MDNSNLLLILTLTPNHNSHLKPMSSYMKNRDGTISGDWSTGGADRAPRVREVEPVVLIYSKFD